MSLLSTVVTRTIKCSPARQNVEIHTFQLSFVPLRLLLVLTGFKLRIPATLHNLLQTFQRLDLRHGCWIHRSDILEVINYFLIFITCIMFDVGNHLPRILLVLGINILQFAWNVIQLGEPNIRINLLALQTALAEFIKQGVKIPIGILGIILLLKDFPCSVCTLVLVDHVQRMFRSILNQVGQCFLVSLEHFHGSLTFLLLQCFVRLGLDLRRDVNVGLDVLFAVLRT